MECPYCGAELILEDSYGNSEYILRGNIEGKLEDIYCCPNKEGFNCKEVAMQYSEANDVKYDNWEELYCWTGSAVNGYFYTDKQGNLYEGYPC